jgi:hypothetical protein
LELEVAEIHHSWLYQIVTSNLSAESAANLLKRITLSMEVHPYLVGVKQASGDTIILPKNTTFIARVASSAMYIRLDVGW